MSSANQKPYIGDRVAQKIVEDICKERELQDSWWECIQPHMSIPEVRSALARLAGIQRPPLDAEMRQPGVYYDADMHREVVQGRLNEQTQSLLLHTIEQNPPQQSDIGRAASFLYISATFTNE